MPCPCGALVDINYSARGLLNRYRNPSKLFFPPWIPAKVQADVDEVKRQFQQIQHALPVGPPIQWRSGV